MSELVYLLNVNTTFFTVIGYPMSYIEFFGTLLTIWCVWLTTKGKVLSWPVGILGTILYLFLFYQIRLYSDFIEQIYFLITSFWGWWLWLHPKTSAETDTTKSLKISYNSKKQNVYYFILVVVGTVALTSLVTRLPEWLPRYFPEPAAYPFVDALTTVMSFCAQWLLAKKKVESWVLWIVVDVLAVWLYWVKGVKFISLEYALFFCLATYGLIRWVREYNSSK